MLSAETAVGKYPVFLFYFFLKKFFQVETVKMMDQIVRAAENAMPERNPFEFNSPQQVLFFFLKKNL